MTKHNPFLSVKIPERKRHIDFTHGETKHSPTILLLRPLLHSRYPALNAPHSSPLPAPVHSLGKKILGRSKAALALPKHFLNMRPNLGERAD